MGQRVRMLERLRHVDDHPQLPRDVIVIVLVRPRQGQGPHPRLPVVVQLEGGVQVDLILPRELGWVLLAADPDRVRDGPVLAVRGHELRHRLGHGAEVVVLQEVHDDVVVEDVDVAVDDHLDDPIGGRVRELGQGDVELAHEVAGDDLPLVVLATAGLADHLDLFGQEQLLDLVEDALAREFQVLVLSSLERGRVRGPQRYLGRIHLLPVQRLQLLLGPREGEGRRSGGRCQGDRVREATEA